MNYIIYAFFFVAALGVFTYFCLPKGWHRGLSTLLFICLAGGVFALSFETAGQPKPLQIEWRKMAELPVVGFLPNQEEQVVYLWVMRDGVPVSYAYPWPSDSQVEGLQDAWRQRGDSGDEFYLVDSTSQIAEVKRPPQLPPKDFEQ